MKTVYHLLLALMLGLGMSMTAGCPTTGSGDDDDTGDDDDDDDDDGAPGPCTGIAASGNEFEPNDDDTNLTNVFPTGDGDVVIFGDSSVCSNDGKNWNGDQDWIGLQYSCNDVATVTLSWVAPSTDMDIVLLDSAGDFVDQSVDASTTSPETLTNVTVNDTIVIGVLCWEGPSGADWTLEVSF